MHIFGKITFRHSFFNMDQPIERMHQTQYKFHTQTIKKSVQLFADD